jgi:hypothetical protein
LKLNTENEDITVGTAQNMLNILFIPLKFVQKKSEKWEGILTDDMKKNILKSIKLIPDLSIFLSEIETL